jgi:flavodoxin
MRARIFYFTGTGNSLIAAKLIAEKIDGQIDPIVKYKEKHSVYVKEEVIGVVFPVYLAQIYGIPEVVKHFFEKLDYNNNKYYFVVCTYGGYAYPNAFPTLNKCIKLVRSCGGNISGRILC